MVVIRVIGTTGCNGMIVIGAVSTIACAATRAMGAGITVRERACRKPFGSTIGQLPSSCSRLATLLEGLRV